MSRRRLRPPKCRKADQVGNIVPIHSERKTCRTCKISKPIGDFSRKENSKTGISTACDECHRERDRKRYERQPERRKDIAKWGYLKWNFGITKDQWHTMLQTQNCRCAICCAEFVTVGRSKNNPCVDHDHATGRLRGLLCRRCNQGIGLLQDSASVAESASAYLKRHGK